MGVIVGGPSSDSGGRRGSAQAPGEADQKRRIIPSPPLHEGGSNNDIG
jgi:hypothetical protein